MLLNVSSKTPLGRRQFEDAVELAPGIVTVRRIEAAVTADEVDFEMHVVVEFDGTRYRCTELTCRQPDGKSAPITTEGLREVAVAEIVAAVAYSGAALFERGTTGKGAVTFTPFRGDNVRAAIEAGGPTDDVLQAVAFLYRFGFALGSAPTKYVQGSLKIPRSTAGRWIAMARERGYLGQTRERKAGVD
jgi:hypothetical protein